MQIDSVNCLRVIKNSGLSASIMNVDQEVFETIWPLLRAVNSTKFQDIEEYGKNAQKAFDAWVKCFGQYKTMTHNLHLLIAHGSLYLRSVQAVI